MGTWIAERNDLASMPKASSISAGLSLRCEVNQLPATSEIIENVFAFADKLLASQREFTAAILEAAKPVYGAADKVIKNGSQAKPAAPAAKTSAAA